MPAARPRIRLQAEERRRQILDAAITLFARFGFRSTGLLSLAERAGVTHSTIHYYFGSKRNLLLSVVAERERVERESMPFVSGSPSGIEGLRAHRAVARTSLANPELVRLFHVLVAESLDRGDPLHGFFHDRYKRVRRDFARVIQGGIDSGEFAADTDPMQIATEYLSFIIGLEWQWLLDPRVNLVGVSDRWFDALEDRIMAPTID